MCVLMIYVLFLYKILIFLCLDLRQTLYTCKQSLMIAYERYESSRDNFGKFLNQFQPKTIILIRKLERILIKLCRQNVPLFF